jgi:flagellar biosynthesis/type III secretory pathway protein FliH
MSRQRVALPTPPSAVRLRTAQPLVEPVHAAPPLLQASAPASHEMKAVPREERPAATARGNPRVEADNAVMTLLESLRTTFEELEQRRRQSLADMQQAAIELAVAIAARIVRTAIDRDQFQVAELAAELVSRLSARGPVVVSLHPADLALLERQLQGRPVPWGADVRVTVHADSTLERGSCRAAAPDLELLSDVQLHVADIREALLESMEDAQTERRQAKAGDRNLRRFPDRRETA